MQLIVKWLLSAAALLPVAYIYSGVQVNSFTAALIASLGTGLLNPVWRPGLVRLPSGARVDDALKAAGGLLPGVDAGSLNLARKLTDGEPVIVCPEPPAAASGSTAARRPDLKTDRSQDLVRPPAPRPAGGCRGRPLRPPPTSANKPPTTGGFSPLLSQCGPLS